MSRKHSIYKACKAKKVHYDFWTVMQHCSALSKIYPDAKIGAYKCLFCEGIHVTTGILSVTRIKRILRNNLRIMSNAEWWIKAPKDVINHTINLEIEMLNELYYANLKLNNTI